MNYSYSTCNIGLIVSSYYSSKTALEKVEANKKQVAAADEGLKCSLIGFDVGENTFIDVLTSQTEKTTARQQLIRSVIEYNKAQAQMLFDTGTISPKTLLQNYQGINHINNLFEKQKSAIPKDTSTQNYTNSVTKTNKNSK